MTNNSTRPLSAELLATSYDELKRMAHSRLRKGEALTLLNTTSLVHEAWVRMSSRNGPWESRAHFFGYAAQAMRSVVVDAARERSALRRGGDLQQVTLATELPAAPGDAEILRVHEALQDLEKLDERLARVVELRYFVGLDESEAAEALNVSRRTVQRDWMKARALLWEAMA
ncbi:ECF-type sigma factor [Dyella amyloliquefaciens]|uniref:ECF-type sigma factor n=1 Tax=Dyella amyloliquefaciens TaxID=1770545 RepID=UPI00197AC4A1|nr:ECF-type sigma factor [Dyella amyloliquefaciens]